MSIKTIITTLALAASAFAAPLDVNGINKGLEIRSSEPPVYIGINLWGSDHENCEDDPARTPFTFEGLKYNDPITVVTPFTTYSLSRALAQHEKIEFYNADLNKWTMEPEGDFCKNYIGTVDWLTHRNVCTQVSAAETDVNCIKLLRK